MCLDYEWYSEPAEAKSPNQDAADERGNELAAADYHIEYIVHGKFKRSQIDQNGIYEAGWVPLRKLVKEVGREIVKQEIMIFESSLHDVCEAELEEISSDDDDSDSDSDGSSD